MHYGSRAHPVTAVDHLSLEVQPGTVTSILGPNGAGKTTTLETCEGFRKPQSGTVRVLGQNPIADARDLKPRIGVMPEKTLKAFADHGEFRGDTVHGTYDDARAVIAGLEVQGISYDEVVTLLEVEGVDKFDASWAELLATVRSALNG